MYQKKIKILKILCHKTSRKTLELLHHPDHHNVEVQIENLGTMLFGDQVEAKVPSFFVTIKKNI